MSKLILQHSLPDRLRSKLVSFTCVSTPTFLILHLYAHVALQTIRSYELVKHLAAVLETLELFVA